MQTKGKAAPAGKTKDDRGDVDESLVKGSREREGKAAGTFAGRLRMHRAADSAVPPASAGSGCLGDLAFCLGADPSSPGREGGLTTWFRRLSGALI